MQLHSAIANQWIQLLGTQEAQARAACLEYECEQGDHNFMEAGLMAQLTEHINLITHLGAHDKHYTNYPSFTGGISQQPDELVLPGQVKVWLTVYLTSRMVW